MEVLLENGLGYFKGDSVPVEPKQELCVHSWHKVELVFNAGLRQGVSCL